MKNTRIFDLIKCNIKRTVDLERLVLTNREIPYRLSAGYKSKCFIVRKVHVKLSLSSRLFLRGQVSVTFVRENFDAVRTQFHRIATRQQETAFQYQPLLLLETGGQYTIHSKILYNG